jgi:hypothetical protein
VTGLSFSDYFSCILKGQKFTDSKENFLTSDPYIDELFTVFDDVRRASIEASEKILEFVGTIFFFFFQCINEQNHVPTEASYSKPFVLKHKSICMFVVTS